MKAPAWNRPPDPSSPESENHRRGPRAFAKEADAFQQCAFGYAGGGEDQLFARSQVFRFINLALVFNSHLPDALFQFRLVDHQPSLHVSVQDRKSTRLNSSHLG